MMTVAEKLAKIKAIEENERMVKELQSLIDEDKTALKTEMESNGVLEEEVGGYTLRYKPVTSNRFDTTGFKKLYADLYSKFTKATTSMRFTIN